VSPNTVILEPPHTISDAGPSEDGTFRLFDVHILMRCPPNYSVLTALQALQDIYLKHPLKEASPHEHDETIGGGTDTILG